MALTKPSPAQIEHPNPRRHRYISFVKSIFRIAAGAALIGGTVVIAGVLLIVAELLGIAEELV
jgi:hypothetical protein